MQQLRNVDPGPTANTQLTQQPGHQSIVLWETLVGQVVWEPYRDVLDSLPPYCIAGRHIWRAIVPLIYFWIVEDHHPEHVFRQFGMKKTPPDIVDTSVDLHRISLQGKLERDWEQEHVVYIDRWAHREEHHANALTLDGDATYLAAYMESYRRTTRRYITRESAYWEILSNVELLLQCEPDSQVYNHLKSTLDLVRELSRVALENARATAIEASTQATGRGRGGRGFGGRGRSGGSGGGHEDEDDFDDEALEGDWGMYMDGVGSSRCMSDAAPSHPTPLAMTIVQNTWF